MVAKGLLLPSLWLGSQGPRLRGSQMQQPQQATTWVVAPHEHSRKQWEGPRWQVKGAGTLGHSDGGSLLLASQRRLQPRLVAGDVPNPGDSGDGDWQPTGAEGAAKTSRASSLPSLGCPNKAAEARSSGWGPPVSPSRGPRTLPG